MKKLTKKKLANYITAVYAANSVDMSINVLDIGKVFKMAETAYAEAGTLAAVDAAVKDAVAKYCTPNATLHKLGAS